MRDINEFFGLTSIGCILIDKLSSGWYVCLQDISSEGRLRYHWFVLNEKGMILNSKAELRVELDEQCERREETTPEYSLQDILDAADKESIE
jgi:hypothetical protein